MVTPTCFAAQDNRRYAHHRSPYPAPFPSQEHRRGNSGYVSGSGYNSPRGDSIERHEDQTSQRKRIAVACGRCRKRKIRCSGDNGTGQPCTNCKNAGEGLCQFLRVQSHDPGFPMKDHSGFNYNVESSRHYQARGSSSIMAPYGSTQPTMTQPTYPDPLGPSPVDAMPYRNGPAYPYGNTSSARSYMPWASGGYCVAVPDSQGDLGYQNHHSLYTQPFPHAHDSRYQVAPYSAPAPRSYAEPEPTGYNTYTQTGSIQPSTAAALPHRPAPTTDAGSTYSSFHNVTLSTSVGSDKTNHGLHHFPRNDSVSSMGTYKSAASPASSGPEATPASSYGSYSSSPVAGAYPPIAPAISSRQDLYPGTPTSSTSPAGSEFQPSTAGGYVYADTSAAAAAVAGVSRRHASPDGSYGASYGLPDEVGHVQRKSSSISLRS